jgi:hypothetical protein
VQKDFGEVGEVWLCVYNSGWEARLTELAENYKKWTFSVKICPSFCTKVLKNLPE